jgi:hypothetical protein
MAENDDPHVRELYLPRGVRLRPAWAGAKPTAREVGVLRSMFPNLGDIPMAELYARALAGALLESGTIRRSQAANLIRLAEAKGLKLKAEDAECVRVDAGTWIPDGAHETPFASGACVFAVGWLSSFHPFSTGTVEPEASDALASMVADRERWLPFASCGVQQCEFCLEAAGSQAILVPSHDKLFIAPDLVAHFVAQHHYRPPDAFLDAVLQCPRPGTDDYYRALRRFQNLWPESPVQRWEPS